MSARLRRAPFLALIPGAQDRFLYHDVPRDRCGELDAETGRLLTELGQWRSLAELEAASPCRDGRPVGERVGILREKQWVVTEADPFAAGFSEDIVIAGYGLRMTRDCSLGVLAVLQGASTVVAFDPSPRIDQLRVLNANVLSLHAIFSEGETRSGSLEHIAEQALEILASRQGAVLAIYGNARVGVYPTTVLLRLAAQRGLSVRILPGASFLEEAFIRFQFDAMEGFALLPPSLAKEARPGLHTIFGTLGYDRDLDGKRRQLQDLVSDLAPRYPTMHPVHLLIGLDDESRKLQVPLGLLPHFAEYIRPGSTSIHVPPAS